MKRYIFWIAALILVFAVQSGSAQTKNAPLSAQSFKGDITIQATPQQVWEALTDANFLTQLLGYEHIGGVKKFSRLGDHAKVKVWGENGTFMMVRAKPKKELRFSLDPESGSYLCSCRWKLTKTSNGTRVQYHERYTESGAQSKEELQQQVDHANKMLKKLKMVAEKR